MTELNPSEAQRKAIIGFLSRPYPHYDPSKPDYEGWLDAFLAAANSIPEGPPVDTIARRPDGEWIAVRRERHWGYRWLKGGGVPRVPPPNPRDADSWPVIYDPREDEAPRLAEAASKPRVFQSVSPTAQQEPKLCSGCYECQPQKPPRTPRVVDRLGVDEQGSRWQDRQLGEWKFDGQAWRYLELTWTSVPGGEWVEAEPSKRYGPYVEVPS